MDFPDQEMTCGGRVKRRWEEDGARLVELELWTKNAKGQTTTPGTAIVEIGR
jgi:hypothetical protein